MCITYEKEESGVVAHGDKGGTLWAALEAARRDRTW